MQTIPRRLTESRCKCSACGEHFNSVSVFDAHRVGSYDIGRRCLTVSEMLCRGWIQNAVGFFIRGHRSNFAPCATRGTQKARSAHTLTQGAAHAS